jgi:hypothetical protein
MSAPTAVPALTMSVAHDGLGDFFTDLVTLFALKDSGLPMGDLNGLISDGHYGDGHYTVNTVNVFGGRMSNPTFSITSIAPLTPGVSDGTFTVQASVCGHVLYDTWYEDGTFSSEDGGTVHIDPYDDTYTDEFSFDVTAMPMTLSVTISAQPDEVDPSDTALILNVAVTEVSYQPAQVENISVPSDSAMNVGDFFNVFSSDGLSMLQSQMSSIDMVAPFVDSMNVMFAAIGDSGQLAPGVNFLFPPTELVYPTTGGFQMAVSGRIIDGGVEYKGTDPVALSLPDIPAAGMTFAFNEYLINEAAWAASKLGALNVTFPVPGAPPSQWTTDVLQAAFPALWDFAPSAPFQLVVSNDPDSSPLFSFMPSWQPTAAVLAGLGVPATVSTALAPFTGTIFDSAADLTAVLNAELLPADFAAWGAQIVAASVGHGLGAVTPYQVELLLPVHGVTVTAVTFDVTLTHWINELGFTADATAGTQAFTFSLDYQASAAANVTSAPGLVFSQTDGEAFFEQVLAPQLNELTAALQAMGAKGVPLPCAPQYVLRDPSLVISDSVILVSGDTHPAS